MIFDEAAAADNLVIHKKEIDAVDIDGEKVMMDLDKGRYYALNSVAARIWELIARPQSIKSIVQALLQEYNIDAKTCEDNVIAFLKMLHSEELIEISRVYPDSL